MKRIIEISLELAQEFGFVPKVGYQRYLHNRNLMTVVVDADELDKRAEERADKAIKESRREKSWKEIYEGLDRLADKWANVMVRASDFD